MTNRLRFRAWDYLSDPPGMVDYVECEEFTLDFLFHDQLDAMQSTGRPDKNGVEIYEGDIVTAKGWSLGFFDDKELNAKRVVTWNERKACWELPNRDGKIPGGLGWPACASTRRLTVIGNIYENPELLEKGK